MTFLIAIAVYLTVGLILCSYREREMMETDEFKELAFALGRKKAKIVSYLLGSIIVPIGLMIEAFKPKK